MKDAASLRQSTGDDRSPDDSGSRNGTDDSSDDEHLTAGTSRKRKRPLKISCELCKARKVKCDRAEPACGWCARNDRLCVYKERKKPGLRPSYGVEVEDKLKRIEATLFMLSQRVDEHISDHTCSNALLPQAHDTMDQRRGVPNIIQRQSNGNHAHQPTEGSTSNQTQRMDILSRSESVSLPPIAFLSEQQRSSTELPPIQALQTNSADLPPLDLLYSLVDLYFKHVNTWSPILDRQMTFEFLFSTPVEFNEEARILLHAIVTVTLRFCRDARLDQNSRRRYHDISRRVVQSYALETSSIVAMKALALITVDALGTSDAMPGWNLISVLCKNIVQSGLGVEKVVYIASIDDSTLAQRLETLGPAEPSSWIDDEGRRRLFWLTYILDRYATVATDSDFVIDEDETDRALPCRYDLFSKNKAVETRRFRHPKSTETIVDRPENLGSFSYHCDVLRILSQIHTFLRKPVDSESARDIYQWRNTYRSLDSRLNTWLSNLPGEYGKISQLCHSDPGSRVSNWIMIHAALVTAVIRLHSVAAYPALRGNTPMFQPSHNAMQRCLSAVESLRAIAQDVLDTHMLDLLGPPFAFALWTSSRLLIVHAATTRTPVHSAIDFLVSTLSSMGQYWQIAQDWAKTLSLVIDEGRAADLDQHHRPNKDDRRTDVPITTDLPTATNGHTFTQMRQRAYIISQLLQCRPKSIFQTHITRRITQAELRFLKLFDWFHYPRQSESQDVTFSTSTSAVSFAHQYPHLLRDDEEGNSRAEQWNVSNKVAEEVQFISPDPNDDWLIDSSSDRTFTASEPFQPPHE